MERKTLTRLVISLLLYILAIPSSYAFGNKGHQLIAEIAEIHLTDKTKSTIARILNDESLAEASTWADKMRYTKDDTFWSYDYSSNWHFVNIGKNRTYAQSQKNQRGDAYIALLSFIELLQNKPVSNPIIKAGLAQYDGQNTRHSKKQLALKFIIHLVSDLHQPLHVGYAEDQGGNKINVRWFGKRTNLHSVWDSRLLNRMQTKEKNLLRKLIIQINAMDASELAEIKHAKPMTWINEGLQLRKHIYQTDQSTRDLSEDYLTDNTPLIEKQLIRAGLRLAETLNQLFQ